MQNSFAEFRTVSTYKLQKFAERLRERRDALGFSNEQLARMAGIGARSIYDYLDQTTTPKGDTIVKLSEVLQCDIGWLFGEERSVAPVTYPAHREEVLELTERLEQVRAAVDATQAVLDTMSKEQAAQTKAKPDPLKAAATTGDALIGAKLAGAALGLKPKAAATTYKNAAPTRPAPPAKGAPKVPPAPVPVEHEP